MNFQVPQYSIEEILNENINEGRTRVAPGSKLNFKSKQILKVIKYLFSLYVWSFVCLQKASVSLEDNGVLEEKSCSRSSYTLPILDGQTVRRSIDWQRNGTRNDRASLGPWNSTTWEAATLENCGSLISPNRWVIFYYLLHYFQRYPSKLCVYLTPNRK